jgi:hypothetical protein
MCGRCDLHEREEKLILKNAGKPKGKRRLGRLGCIWEYVTKVDHKERIKCLS